MNTSLSLRPSSSMAWNIFRKDWKLLWPLAIAVAGLQALLGWVRFGFEPFAASQAQEALAGIISLVLIIAMILLIVLAVQQDAIPGVTQDWLVRPIRRRDLLLAKLLGVVLLIHGPIFVVNMVHGLAEGFSLGPLLRATLLGGFEIALLFTLPAMAIAGLTRSLTEALLGSLAVILGLILTHLVITRALHVYSATSGTGLAWIWDSLSHFILLLSTVAVLLLQYFRRTTNRSRMLLAGGLALFLVSRYLPWHPAFAIQRWLSPDPGAAQSVLIAVDPALRHQPSDAIEDRLATQLFTEDSDADTGKTAAAKDTKDTQDAQDTKDTHDIKDTIPILLPLRFSGLPHGVILHADRAEIRLLDDDNEVVFRRTGQIFDVSPPDSSEGSALVYQSVPIPARIYRRLQDQTLRLTADYSMTLLRAHLLPPLPAPNGQRRLPEAGRCASRMTHDGAAIEVSCRTAGELPPCLSMTLESVNAADGASAPDGASGGASVSAARRRQRLCP